MTVSESYTPHFDEMTGLAYLEQQLDNERSKAMETHAQTCANCRELLRVLKNESVWLREAMTSEEEAVPARFTGAADRASLHWGWLTSLAFGAAGAYTLWTGLVEPWMAQASNLGLTQGNIMTMLFFSGAFWSGWSDVLNAVEFLAIASLAGVAVWALRRFFRRQTRVAVAAMLGVLAFAIAPLGARAADTEHGNPDYTLPAGQEVKTDLFVAADHVMVDGDVDGDLVVTGHDVEVNGHIKGDILSFAQELRVNGTVDGNVRVFAQEGVLNGSIGKNVMGFVRGAEVDEKASVGGSATLLARDAQMNGPVKGDLMLLAENANINAAVGGDAKIHANSLQIGSSARIAGKTEFEGPQEPQVAPGAKLASPIEIVMERPKPQYSTGRYYLHQVFRWGAAFVFGMVLFLLAPGLYLDAAHEAQRGGLAMGIGLLFLVGVPVAVVVACFTVIGLGVGLATFLIYVVAVYMSQIFVGAWLGERLMGAGMGTGQVLARLAVGLAILRVLRMIPFVGWVSVAVVIVWGLGAYVMTVQKRIRHQAVIA